MQIFRVPSLGLLPLFAFPISAFAQESAGQEFSQLLLTIAIVLGILASIYVYTLSSKMAGGAIGTALTLYGVGMLCIVFSLMSVTWLKSFLGAGAGTAHDLFFILGFLFMVFGSRRVTNVL